MWSILRHAVRVILEHAVLPVKPGEENRKTAPDDVELVYGLLDVDPRTS